MKAKILILFLTVVLLLVTGCAYVHIKAPFDTDLEKTELGTKKGTADAYCLLWLVAWGDAGYAEAARNGDIRVMKHADQEVRSYLGIWTYSTVYVYGE